MSASTRRRCARSCRRTRPSPCRPRPTWPRQAPLLRAHSGPALPDSPGYKTSSHQYGHTRKRVARRSPEHGARAGPLGTVQQGLRARLWHRTALTRAAPLRDTSLLCIKTRCKQRGTAEGLADAHASSRLLFPYATTAGCDRTAGCRPSIPSFSTRVPLPPFHLQSLHPLHPCASATRVPCKI